MKSITVVYLNSKAMVKGKWMKGPRWFLCVTGISNLFFVIWRILLEKAVWVISQKGVEKDYWTCYFLHKSCICSFSRLLEDPWIQVENIKTSSHQLKIFCHLTYFQLNITSSSSFHTSSKTAFITFTFNLQKILGEKKKKSWIFMRNPT